MHGQILWQRPLPEPGGVCAYHHVYHGLGTVLPRHLLVVYHLEHGIQYRTVVLLGIVDLDPMEGYLY